VTLEVIDDEPEPIAKAAQRLGELMTDFDRDITAKLHRLLVNRNQVSFTPP
jgi:hypothetical protein